ncbi:hypothetical protein T484DRAFT_1822843 [Baffinella frigidus]|nr:hypothetical protein T484DRAFT_1822843 [Cryptophyta sp. CCMP2293]
MSLLSLRPGHSFHSCQILKSLGNVCGKVHASSSMRRLALRTQGGFAGRSTGGSRAAGGALTWTCAAVTAEEGAGAGAEPPTGKLDGPEEAFLDGEGMVLSEADEREAIAQARPLAKVTEVVETMMLKAMECMRPAPMGELHPTLFLDNAEALLNEPVYKSVMYRRLESCNSEGELQNLEEELQKLEVVDEVLLQFKKEQKMVVDGVLLRFKKGQGELQKLEVASSASSQALSEL